MKENILNSSKTTTKTANITNITAYINKVGFSAQNAEYDSIRCGICFEPFHIKKRLPKSLPCEHSFCEQCIFSLCCHQQYYLLDSINCPTCCTEFSTTTALAATTNFGLCQLLEKVQLQQMETSNDANITVIHVPDSNCITRDRLVRLHSWHKNSRPSFGSKRCQLMQCTDCSRKMNEKKCRKEARFCAKCFSVKKDDDDCLRLICLECCVNRHNGHKLVTLSELECQHQKLIKDLRNLQQSIQKINKWLEASLKMLSEDSTIPATDCVALHKTKQNLRNECEADMKFALSVLENGGTTPLPPAALQRMRQHQYHNSARLHKLLHFIEKCNGSANERHNRSIKLDTSMSHSSLCSLNRQTRIALSNSASNDRSVAEAIATVLAVTLDHRSRFENVNRVAVVEKAMKVLSKKNSTKAVRRAALLCCAKQLREFIDESITRQLVLLYIDAYLHIFYQLNLLVTRFPSDENNQDVAVIRRSDIWKLIQGVYSDLMRCAAKHWRSEESERVDLVDDLAFLCFLYSDVCDEATITICMIEAARSRAAAAAAAISTSEDACKKLNRVEDDGRLIMNMRLNLIDKHLLECRRVQKLQQLRATTVIRLRKCILQHSLKYIWKLLFGCFDKSMRHR
uniref:RING-type domain-containing protein n=1 Tax=Onchocerca volvulus TaxID=6282 RepID=A0A8R1XYM6_ONCVO